MFTKSLGEDEDDNDEQKKAGIKPRDLPHLIVWEMQTQLNAT